MFWNCHWGSSNASVLFSRSDFSLSGFRKEVYELNVGKVVGNMTRGRYIPTVSVRSEHDCSSLVHNIGPGSYVESNKNNSRYLVG